MTDNAHVSVIGCVSLVVVVGNVLVVIGIFVVVVGAIVEVRQ